MAVWMHSRVAPPVATHQLAGVVLKESELMGKRMELPRGRVVVAPPPMNRKSCCVRMSVATGQVAGEVKVYTNMHNLTKEDDVKSGSNFFKQIRFKHAYNCGLSYKQLFPPVKYEKEYIV